MVEYLIGSICWDFKKLRTEFQLNGEKFLLKGTPPKKMRAIEYEPSSKLFENAAHLYLIQVFDES